MRLYPEIDHELQQCNFFVKFETTPYTSKQII